MLRMTRKALIKKICTYMVAMTDPSMVYKIYEEGHMGYGDLSNEELIGLHNNLFNEDVEIDEEPKCEHEPDWTTVQWATDNIVDVYCTKCGCSGSFATEASDVMWG